jgi:hypothetical protein
MCLLDEPAADVPDSEQPYVDWNLATDPNTVHTKGIEHDYLTMTRKYWFKINYRKIIFLRT